MSSSSPKLIIIGGFAGAGKTTISEKLSAGFGLPLFSSDVFGKSLSKLIEKHVGKTQNLQPAIYPIAYDLLFEIVGQNLKSGLTLILDANMCQSQTWESIEKLKKEIPELQCLPIILDIEFGVAKDRVQKRKNFDPENHDLGSANLEKIMEKFEFIKSFNYPGLIKVDANRDIQTVYFDTVKIIKKFL